MKTRLAVIAWLAPAPVNYHRGGEMKKRILAVTAALALLGLTPSSSLAYSGTGTAFPLIVIDNSYGDQSQPHVSGNYAAYNIVTTGGANIIGYYSFSPAGNATIPSAANAIDNLSDVSGNTIVFTRIDTNTGASAIYKYTIGGTATEVAPVTAPAIPLRSNPSIGGSAIAWEDMGLTADTSTEIVLTTNGTTTVRVTNDAFADQNPNVSPAGDVVVWEKCNAGTCDVYAATAAGGWAPVAVSATAANETWPDTNGSQIVFASDSSGTSHIYISTIGGTATQIPASTTTQDHPAIAGRFIAYEGGTASSHDIYVYDTASGTTYQITNTTENELLSDITISGTTVRVVWQVSGGASGTDVYASEFVVASEPPSEPPFSQHFLQPLAQSTDRANPVINVGKNGRVIPVKVQITQGSTEITDVNAPGPVTIAVSKLASCSSSAGTDPIETYADSGQSSAGTNQFRYDATAQAWVYNLDTKALGLVTGNCYRIDVSVNGTQITNAFAVFQPTK
jgi:hypothetical protein